MEVDSASAWENAALEVEAVTPTRESRLPRPRHFVSPVQLAPATRRSQTFTPGSWSSATRNSQTPENALPCGTRGPEANRSPLVVPPSFFAIAESTPTKLSH